MCGRFALGVPRPEIYEVVRGENPELDLDEWVDEDVFQPRYNIAPRTRSVVIRIRNGYDDSATETIDENGRSDSTEGVSVSTASKTEDGRQTKPKAVLHTMKWGLVPHWSKHEDTSLNTINAKGENLTDGGGGMWNSIKGKKRCAILCQGYYEWLKKGKERIPHFTKHEDGRLMLLAGLYDSALLEGTTERLYTFTIVTTDASKQLDWLHDRMPVVLPNATALTAWLDTSSQTWDNKAAALIKSYPLPDPNSNPNTMTGKVIKKGKAKGYGPLECYAVPTDVGKVGTESATFIEPVQRRRDGIEAMFARAKKIGKAVDGKEGEEGKATLKIDETNESAHKRKRTLPVAEEEKERDSSVELLDGPPVTSKKTKNSSSSNSPSPKKKLKSQA